MISRRQFFKRAGVMAAGAAAVAVVGVPEEDAREVARRMAEKYPAGYRVSDGIYVGKADDLDLYFYRDSEGEWRRFIDP